VKLKPRIKIDDSDIHPHIRTRMQQRGVTREEIERVINEGWEADDSKPGVIGKVFVFPYNREWEGARFEEKEVSVYYKQGKGQIILLTAKARYGRDFPKKEQ